MSEREESPAPPRPERRDALLALGLVLLSGAFFLTYWRYNVALTDEGHVVHLASRILEGEVLYRDLHRIYPPGRDLLAAALFLLTGPSLLTVHGVNLVLRAVCVGLAYLVGRRFLAPVAALMPALLLIAVPGAWHKVYYTLFSLLGILVLARFLERPAAGRAATLGLVVSLACQFRQDIGAMLALLGLVTVLLAPPAGRRLRLLAVSVAAGLLAAAPVLAGMALLGALPDMAWLLVVPLWSDSPRWGIATSALTLGADGGAMLGRRMTSAFIVVELLVLAAAGGRGAWLLLRRKALANRDLVVLLVAALGILGANQMFRWDPLARLLQCGAPAYLLVAAFFGSAVLGLGRAPRPWRLVPWAFAALLVGHVWTAPMEGKLGLAYTGSGAVRWMEDRVLLDVRGETVYLRPDDASVLRAVRGVIERRTEPGATLFALGSDPYLYHWTGRRNPTRFGWVTMFNWVPLPERHWEGAVARLEKERPALIVARHPMLRHGPFQERWGRRILAGYETLRVLGPWTLFLRGDLMPPEGEGRPAEKLRGEGGAQAPGRRRR